MSAHVCINIHEDVIPCKPKYEQNRFAEQVNSGMFNHCTKLPIMGAL